MNDNNVTLLSNAGVGNGAAKAWQGGAGVFTAEATFGGGTVKLQFMTLNSTWVDYPSGSLSAAGALSFTLPICQIRAVATTATAVYAYAHPVQS